MELRNLIKKLNAHRLLLLAFFFVGGVLGATYFSLPGNYTATGSLFVKRAVDLTRFNYFAYEGYYGQQTALSYTNTLVAMMESIDLRKNSLDRLGIQVNEQSLIKYSRQIKVKKAGPQLITLTVKDRDFVNAQTLWNAVADSTIEISRNVNQTGDPFLNISKISEEPVIKPQYKPLWLCLPIGMMFGFVAGVFLVTVKEYFKWK